MAYTDQFDLTQNVDFVKKVRVAMCTAATQIVGEAQTTMPFHEWRLRHRLGVAVLNNPDDYVQRFLDAVVTNAAIVTGSIDSDIQFQVNAVFGDVAGVGGHSKL